MRIIVLLLVCLANPLSAAEVYRWVDSQGVAHYSQLPPAEAANDNLHRINTAYTPAQQTQIEQARREETMNKLLAEDLPPAAAGGEDTCSALAQDKYAYEKRRIESTYINARNECDVSFNNDKQKQQRISCYATAEQIKHESMNNVAKVKYCN